MSKLIGTNPNQVPSNADLGTAAFMNRKEFLLSKGSEMSAIDSVVSDTAIDVFIYDTNKDSDGGAWRKRTSHTSWYNERLNTTTRGSRKEFPSVAVIVMESDKVTIYDADDINMPMWMVFKQGSWYHIHTGGASLTSVYMLNGMLCWTGFRLGLINFIKDATVAMEVTWYNTLLNPIAGRNVAPSAASAIRAENLGFDIVNNTTNDVAMTVFPNAPIDADTGLPVPTIAVATDGGVSVIKDTGVVWDIVSSTAAGGGYDPHHVSFDQDNRLTLVQAYDLSAIYLDIFDSLPTENIGQALSYSSATSYTYLDTGLNVTGTTTATTFADLAHAKDDIAMGTNKQLTLLNSTPGAPTKSMVAYVTSDYNTGWMVGDTKLATLSDTNMVDLDGTDFVTNGNFSSSDLSSFSAYNSGSLGASIAVDGGALKLTHTGTTNYAFATFTWAAEIGQVYRVSCDLKNGNASYAHLKPHSGCLFNPSEKVVSGTSYESTTHTVTATATTAQLRLQLVGSNGQYVYFDNVSVTLAEADRTINNESLKVFGTVPKTPVMPGAELMAYGPFTSSNYLEQPYNSDLNFGTGDFMYSMWIYRNSLPTSTHERWFGTSASDSADRIDIFSNHATDNIAFYSYDAGATKGDVRMTGIGINKWHCFHFTRQANVYKIYHDGELRATNVGSATLADYGANTDRRTHIGAAEHWDSGHAVLDGKIALAKISGTVPTSQQIRKMYNDEKYLFQENAKATLYGTSNAITALAYDDDTELLHVGTSAGRSVFHGLNRVDNTTDAVGASISASNGLVAED